MSNPRPSQRFLIAITSLKTATGDSPERLAALFTNDVRLSDLCAEVREAWRLIDHISAHRKSFPQVDPHFIESEKDYRHRWRPVVEYVSDWDLLTLNIMDEPDYAPPTYAEYKAGKYWLRPKAAPDPETDDTFDPARHDGGAALRAMFDEIVGYGFAFDDERANVFNVGIGALQHFQTTTQIRIDDAFDRWNRLPPIFVPRHVSNRHGLTDRESLFGLLDEAVRAYVAGIPGGAAALCRAVLERVLKDHYLPGTPGDLKDLIVLACARFDHLQRKKLDSIRERGNEILHRGVGLTGPSGQDEATLLQCFKDLKFMIEKAPEKRASK